MSERVVTVNDLLDGHVALDIQCLDRIYLNAYIPRCRPAPRSPRSSPGTWAFRFPPSLVQAAW